MPPPLAPRARFEGFTIVRELQVSARSHVHLAVDDAPRATRGAQDSVGRPARRRRPPGPLRARGMGGAAHRQPPRAQGRHAATGRAATCSSRWSTSTARRWRSGWSTIRRPSLDSVRSIVEQLAKGLQAFHGQRDAAPGPAPRERDDRPHRHREDHRLRRRRTWPAWPTHAAAPARRHRRHRCSTPRRSTSSARAAAPRSDLFSLAVHRLPDADRQLPYGLQASRAFGRRRRASACTTCRCATSGPTCRLGRRGAAEGAAPGPCPSASEAVSEFAHDLKAPGPEVPCGRGARP